MKIKFVFTVFLAFIVNSLYAQSGGSSAFVGKWSLVEGPTRNNPEIMILGADGTGTVDGEGFAWKTENNRFYLIHPLLSFSWSYQVSVSTLTLTDNNGTILKYSRQAISTEYDDESSFRAEPVAGGNTVRITGYNGNKWTVRIPPSIRGISVTHIWLNAFRNKKLTGVTIPNGVTNILDTAFADNQLTSITLPDSVTSLGQYAFFNNRLSGVTIPGGVTEIKAGTFANNPLTSVTIGAGVTLATDEKLDFGVYSSFGNNGFEKAYISGGKRAGTYTRPDTKSTVWTRK